MEQKHRNAIQENFSSLVAQTDLNQMVSSLYERGVFSEAMIEPYKDKSIDESKRKRQLYREIERRGPKAFPKLIEVLNELGHWDLVRALNPDSVLNRKKITRFTETQALNSKDPKRKVYEQQFHVKQREHTAASECPPDLVSADLEAPREEIPKFNVVKSVSFCKEDDVLGNYKTRSTKRGILLVFNFMKFNNNTDEYRKGAEVDSKNLKYLFDEIGFMKPIIYNNLTKKQIEDVLYNINEKFDVDIESVFVLVSSHGYENLSGNDTDIRCSDGGLITSRYIIEHFNNNKCPRLFGKPKVFIFQTCRGNAWVPPDSKVGHKLESDGSTLSSRVYSDILVAYSTLIGFVSLRDPLNGTLYIQSFCKVFAANAHDTDVEVLLRLVDKDLERKQYGQTSSVENWGFNHRLYLHPGLFETDDKKHINRGTD